MSGEAPDRWALTLYFIGSSPSSVQAIETVRRVCDEDLGGHVDLDVIDVREQPALAAGDQIVATPTLVKHLPGRPRRIVGDLSDAARLRLRLEVSLLTTGDGRPDPDQ
jgi:circadian clock protein KaiB